VDNSSSVVGAVDAWVSWRLCHHEPDSLVARSCARDSGDKSFQSPAHGISEYKESSADVETIESDRGIGAAVKEHPGDLSAGSRVSLEEPPNQIEDQT
jgi:hypothetical protein